ncbi:hypothetical protein B566_EDAN004336 [Ephemera danica]|nr:hypothetical protein B566_EDAN004336 [Ephemera danica]
MARQLQRLYSRALLSTFGDNVAATGLISRYLSSSNDNIPVPTNVEEMDASQKVQFSRQRSRDITGPVLQPQGGSFGPGFMSGALEKSQNATDAHLGSYDCTGAVSLHSVMQTNVPEPFTASGKAPSHLNMPGGQWSQEDKYLSQERQDAKAVGDNPLPLHYNQKSNKADMNCSGSDIPSLTVCVTRQFSTDAATSPSPPPAPLSRKEQLKRAFKEYGSTVIIFHVCISLISLGGCYLAVSSGLDVVAMLEKIGLTGRNSAITGASTFVVAYAVHKVFAPVRISITLGATPFIVRYLRRTGFLKTPKPKSS